MSDELISKGAQASLLKHPLITSVTPQRRVTRTLHSVMPDDDDADFEDESSVGDDDPKTDGFDRWTRGRRSLAFGNDATTFIVTTLG